MAGVAFGEVCRRYARILDAVAADAIEVVLGLRTENLDVVVLARFAQIPGGFLLAATFLLELLGVDRERALAMALIVQVSATVSLNAAAAASLAWFGAELRELKALYASGSLPGAPPQRRAPYFTSIARAIFSPFSVTCVTLTVRPRSAGR